MKKYKSVDEFAAFMLMTFIVITAICAVSYISFQTGKTVGIETALRKAK